MAKIKFIKPSDQPQGLNRLLNELIKNLENPEFNSFKFIVAYMKLTPFLKLFDNIQEWNKVGNKLEGISGIDQNGTSTEAIRFCLNYFDYLGIIHMKGRFSPTFHPKIYIFKGEKKAIAYLGSNNLTFGGTEVNFESYIRITLESPKDDPLLKQIEACWDDSYKHALECNEELLNRLVKDKLVISEKEIKEIRAKAKSENNTSNNKADIDEIPFLNFKIFPPNTISANTLKSVSISITESDGGSKEKKSGHKTKLKLTDEDLSLSTLIMHISPHHNGEILLSKLAVNQKPSFFGYPFTGETIPKKEDNESYPQRVPDPIVNIVVYDSDLKESLLYENFNLNTIYYTLKSEIRITVPMDIIRLTEPFTDGPYPILLITDKTEDVKLDYILEIYLPGSQRYDLLETKCNQNMPSGGKTLSRKFGWM
jgi:HKD family nuclease